MQDVDKKEVNQTMETDPLPVQNKKKRKRTIGDEEDMLISSIEDEIRGIEAEITRDASKYEECRRIMSFGVTSKMALEQTRKMEVLISKLKELRAKRNAAMIKKDMHIVGFANGNRTDQALEEIREERAMYKRRNPDTKKETLKDALMYEENTVEMMKKINAIDQSLPRKNSENCPTKCTTLVEDVQTCSMVCSGCGYVYKDLRVDSENPVCTATKFGENFDVTKKKSGGYKPLVHLTEIMGHFQGNRASVAPPDVMDKVSDYCIRYHHESHTITPGLIRFFLKRMQQDENNRHECALAKNPKDKVRRYTDYYKHVNEMAYRLSGIPPPYLTPMQEDKITVIFPLTTAAYKTSPRFIRMKQMKQMNQNCIKEDPNNSNYSYTFYKICQLLGYGEFLPYISLPKNTENIDDLDENFWKHTCNTYGWKYIPTR